MLEKIKDYIKLARVRHWLKNIIVFIPAFYGGAVLRENILLRTAAGFLVFSLCSSAVYALNDLCDAEKDSQHPIKCRRPIASGRIGKGSAAVFSAVLAAAGTAVDMILCGFSPGAAVPVLYLALNILYSKRLKNIPVIDLVILVSGFVLRLIYGSVITDVRISSWLYLTLISLSLFMAFGKRRSEKIRCGRDTRSVLERYTLTYLSGNMYMFLGLFLVFYALWSVNTSAMPGMVYTTPLVIIMTMRYTFRLESDSSGNPIDMIVGDGVMIMLGVLYAAFVFVQIYFPEVIHECLRL